MKHQPCWSVGYFGHIWCTPLQNLPIIFILLMVLGINFSYGIQCNVCLVYMTSCSSHLGHAITIYYVLIMLCWMVQEVTGGYGVVIHFFFRSGLDQLYFQKLKHWLFVSISTKNKKNKILFDHWIGARSYNQSKISDSEFHSLWIPNFTNIIDW